MASTDTSRLANFQKHFEDMRALIHCKICLKPFYEPYTLSCGHTYCYSCLSSWCGGTHTTGKKKTCPDCRAIVETQPSPNFLLRDLVQMFLTHTELLPEDETIKEHKEGRAAEIAAVAADRAGPGLFKGVFQKKRRHIIGPLVDDEDGVDRCPICAWELEGPVCDRCGWSAEMDDDDVSLGSYNSDEDDRDISPIEELERRIIERPHPFGRPIVHDPFDHLGFHQDIDDPSEGEEENYISPGPNSDGDEDDENQSEDDDEMNSFISNDDDDDLPDEVDDDDQSVSTVHGNRPTRNSARTTRQYNTDGDSSSESEHDGRELSPPRQFFGIDLTGGSDDDDASSNDDSTIVSNPTVATTENGETGDEDRSEQHTEYDTDASVREISPPPSPPTVARPVRNTAKRRRVVIDDDEDDEEHDSSEESDDTAIRPPHNQMRATRFRTANINDSPPRPLRSELHPMGREAEVPRGRARRGRGWRPSEPGTIHMPRRARFGTTRVH